MSLAMIPPGVTVEQLRGVFELWGTRLCYEEQDEPLTARARQLAEERLVAMLRWDR